MTRAYRILFALAVITRLVLINNAQLWYDENFTLILARLPFDRMITATAGDVHPPLWYLIEWGLFHAAPWLPAWAIRIPSVIFSLLAFWMFWRVCSALYIPGPVTTAAAAMMAILPMQVWYAQEGRMYSMLEFLVLAALWTGLTRRWFWFFWCALLMLYTQNYGVIYCAVIGAVLMAGDWRRSAAPVAAAGFAAAQFFLPWVLVIISQMGEIEGRYWIVEAGPGALLKTIYQQFWASSVLRPGIVPSYVFTFAVILIGLYAMLSQSRAWWPVAALAFAPFALAWLISVAWQPILLYRALIGASPFLYLIAAWPVQIVLASPRRILYAACFVIPLWMLGLGGYYANIARMKGEAAISPLLTALDYVRAHWQDGDVIYYTDDGPMVNLMPYTDLPQYRMGECEPKTGYSTLGSLSHDTRIAIGAEIAELDEIPHRRAWVFAPRSPLHPACYEEQLAGIVQGDPLILVYYNEYMMSGVWLVEAE